MVLHSFWLQSRWRLILPSNILKELSVHTGGFSFRWSVLWPGSKMQFGGSKRLIFFWIVSSWFIGDHNVPPIEEYRSWKIRRSISFGSCSFSGELIDFSQFRKVFVVQIHPVQLVGNFIDAQILYVSNLSQGDDRRRRLLGGSPVAMFGMIPRRNFRDIVDRQLCSRFNSRCRCRWLGTRRM